MQRYHGRTGKYLAMVMLVTWLAASWVFKRLTTRTAWRELPPVGGNDKRNEFMRCEAA